MVITIWNMGVLTVSTTWLGAKNLNGSHLREMSEAHTGY